MPPSCRVTPAMCISGNTFFFLNLLYFPFPPCSFQSFLLQAGQDWIQRALSPVPPTEKCVVGQGDSRQHRLPWLTWGHMGRPTTQTRVLSAWQSGLVKREHAVTCGSLLDGSPRALWHSQGHSRVPSDTRFPKTAGGSGRGRMGNKRNTSTRSQNSTHVHACMHACTHARACTVANSPRRCCQGRRWKPKKRVEGVQGGHETESAGCGVCVFGGHPRTVFFPALRRRWCVCVCVCACVGIVPNCTTLPEGTTRQDDIGPNDANITRPGL